jgi:hypothetical protein
MMGGSHLDEGYNARNVQARNICVADRNKVVSRVELSEVETILCYSWRVVYTEKVKSDERVFLNAPSVKEGALCTQGQGGHNDLIGAILSLCINPPGCRKRSSASAEYNILTDFALQPYLATFVCGTLWMEGMDSKVAILVGSESNPNARLTIRRRWHVLWQLAQNAHGLMLAPHRLVPPRSCPTLASWHRF